MIDEKYLKKMSKEQLDQVFDNDVRVIQNYYNSGLIINKISGVTPEQAINDIFDEMKQIWVQSLSIEIKGGK